MMKFPVYGKIKVYVPNHQPVEYGFFDLPSGKLPHNYETKASKILVLVIFGGKKETSSTGPMDPNTV